MSAETLVQQLADTVDQSNLCVVLRPAESGLEALLVADEQGRWSIPGGHAKGSESRAEACVREVKEESGLDVEVHPLFSAKHAARERPVTLFYCIVGQNTEARPGGGDVTAARWTPVNQLGSLNGTDRLAIAIAANRVHSPQTLVDDAVELAENNGYAVGNVLAPPPPPPEVSGIHARLTGNCAVQYARALAEWATARGWKAGILRSGLCESTTGALERARRERRLTPVMEAIILVSDALWRYERLTAPALACATLVIEEAAEIEQARLLSRGVPPDLLAELMMRIPVPTLVFDTGDDRELIGLQSLKEALESLYYESNPDADSDVNALIGSLPSRVDHLATLVKAKTCTKEEAVEYAIIQAESVLHIFEKDFPDDTRPRQAVEAARKWWREPSEANRLAAADAAYAAADNAAGYAAYAAADAYAAYAAADAYAAYAAAAAYLADKARKEAAKVCKNRAQRRS